MSKNVKCRIKELENKISQQQEELARIKKKAKRTSFWLFWLLKDKY